MVMGVVGVLVGVVSKLRRAAEKEGVEEKAPRQVAKAVRAPGGDIHILLIGPGR